MKPGDLFVTTASVPEAFHVYKNPHGIWVPKQRDLNERLRSNAPYSSLIKSTIPQNTPVMYIGTDGRPHVGVFLVADSFLELPYNILKPIEVYLENKPKPTMGIL